MLLCGESFILQLLIVPAFIWSLTLLGLVLRKYSCLLISSQHIIFCASFPCKLIVLLQRRLNSHRMFIFVTKFWIGYARVVQQFRIKAIHFFNIWILHSHLILHLMCVYNWVFFRRIQRLYSGPAPRFLGPWWTFQMGPLTTQLCKKY